VNLVLNKNFVGFKANIEGGDSWKDDRQSWKIESAWGDSFFGDRLHLQASAQYQDSPNEIHPNQRAWFQDTQLVNNPAYTATNGQPKLIHANNVGYSTATTGGVIVSNPAGVINGVTVPGSANAFANIQFLGAGVPAPFNPGNVSGAYSNGGNSDTLGADIGNHTLTQNYRNVTAFAYASYKITPDIQASLQLNYGKSVVMNLAVPATKLGNLVLHSDNAFLDPTLAAQMARIARGNRLCHGCSGFRTGQCDGECRGRLHAGNAPLGIARGPRRGRVRRGDPPRGRPHHDGRCRHCRSMPVGQFRAIRGRL
jgi:hypothetical protein